MISKISRLVISTSTSLFSAFAWMVFMIVGFSVVIIAIMLAVFSEATTLMKIQCINLTSVSVKKRLSES